MIDGLNYITGNNLNLVNHLKSLVNLRNWRKNIWIFTNPLTTINKPYYYCNFEKNNNFKHPIDYGPYVTKIIPLLNKILFKYFLKNKIKYHGLVVTQTPSYLDHNGIFKQEEFIINNKSIINYVKRDLNNNLDWTNWKFKNFNIKENFSLSNKFSLQKQHNNILQNPNVNFALNKFYFNNKTELPVIKGNNYIFSYNIHSFNNINQLIDTKDNYNNIIKLIKKYNENINYLIFQEVRFDNITKKMVSDTLTKLGFNIIKYTKNGMNNDDMSLLFASKDSLDINIINHKDSKYIYRNSILFSDTDNIFTGCAVHLTIGERYKHDIPEYKNENLKIKEDNYNKRVNQLKGIIKHKPDFIIGDFNFTHSDNETNFMLKNGYIMVTPKTPNSTPYNRVDMCFVHKNSSVKFKNNKTIKCNYSDHLPFMLQIY